MLEKIACFNKSMEENKSKVVVKSYFKYYQDAYHNLRSPTKAQTEEYLDLYLKFMEYQPIRKE